MDPRLSEAEKALRLRAREATAAIKAAAAGIDGEKAGARALLTGLGKSGILGVCVAEAHGGGGGGRTEYALICEEIGAASASVAAAAIGHMLAMLMVGAVASDQEAGEILPQLASGARLAALLLDDGGSLLERPVLGVGWTDAGDEMILNGRARGVAGATQADVFVVPARGGSGDSATKVFVLEKSAPGLQVGVEHDKLGLNGSGLASVALHNVAGSPLLSSGDAAAALERIEDEARIGLAAASIGIARAALEAGTAHALGGDGGLGRAQSVQWMLADMATETEAARLLAWYAASRTDAGELRETAAMARMVASQAAVAASRRAVQILGAAGNDRASGVERLYRDAKAMEIHHGAAESQQLAVARRLLPDLFDDAG